LNLTAIAGLTACQVDVLLGNASGVPLGLSLIGRRNGDAALIGVACSLTRNAVSAWRRSRA
jgi:Asp-tRNA(Asn)/Glu-tRNA(Gln) amidotransferase A subunit family amidase